MANMITSGKQQATGKSVLLFSGGMDSLMFDYLMNPDVLLYIPTGSKYESIETEKLSVLGNKGYIDSNKLVLLPDVLNLSLFERDDAIVPNRNAHLMLIASMYGEKLILGSVQGDRSFDKDPIFYEKMTDLLNHMWKEQHWTEERIFKVSSPYKDKTKTEIVKEYLEKGGSEEALLESYSCYEPQELSFYEQLECFSQSEQTCGWCKPCFRKWISLHNNNISIPEDYYANNPWEAPWLEKLIPSVLEKNYRGKEDYDWCEALTSKGVI